MPDAPLLPWVAKWRPGSVGAGSGVLFGAEIKIVTTGDSHSYKGDFFLFFFFKRL